MTKREEYNLKFDKVKIGKPSYLKPMLYTVDAIGEYKYLAFIHFLDITDVEDIIYTINCIQTGQPYDPDFLYSSEIYTMFNVRFFYPNIIVQGKLTIHIDDMKLLLQEWLSFVNSLKN